jgi:hypothetical protein
MDSTHGKGCVGFRQSNDEQGSIAHVTVTSPDGTVLFKDDFAKGLDQWVNTENASIRDGWLTVKDTETMRSRAGADWANYAIEAELGTKDAPLGLVFRSSDDSRNCYMWQFVPTTKRLRPHKKVNGSWWVIKDIPCMDVDESAKPFHARENGKGGTAYFAPQPTAGTLQAILDDALPVADVAFEGAPRVDGGGGMLSYLHKVKDGAAVYYFANSSDEKVDTWVRLRGKMALQQWDAHSGSVAAIECEYIKDKQQEVTRVHLVLEPVKAVFLVQQAPDKQEGSGWKKKRDVRIQDGKRVDPDKAAHASARGIPGRAPRLNACLIITEMVI